MSSEKTTRLYGWADNFSDRAHFLALGVEELAFHLLAHMRDDAIHKDWTLRHACIRLPSHLNEEICKVAVCEAWYWLETEAFLIPVEGYKPANQRHVKDASTVPLEEFRTLTKRAFSLDLDQDPAERVKAIHYPRDLFHPSLLKDVWPLFVSGKHSIAVLAAMSEVESRARQLGVGSAKKDAQALFNALFDPGGIMDTSYLGNFDQKYVGLFYGNAFSCFRNPTAHGRVEYDTATAFELLMLAGLLLRIMETSRKGRE
jgi:hypothetical protein